MAKTVTLEKIMDANYIVFSVENLLESSEIMLTCQAFLHDERICRICGHHSDGRNGGAEIISSAHGFRSRAFETYLETPLSDDKTCMCMSSDNRQNSMPMTLYFQVASSSVSRFSAIL